MDVRAREGTWQIIQRFAALPVPHSLLLASSTTSSKNNRVLSEQCRHLATLICNKLGLAQQLSPVQEQQTLFAFSRLSPGPRASA